MRYTITKWRQQQSNRFRHASISFLLLFCLSSPPTTMIYRKCASIVVSVYIWYLLFIINYYLYLKVSVTWHAMIPAIRQSFSIQLPIYQRLTRTALDALCVSPCVLLSIASRKSTIFNIFWRIWAFVISIRTTYKFAEWCRVKSRTFPNEELRWVPMSTDV